MRGVVDQQSSRPQRSSTAWIAVHCPSFGHVRLEGMGRPAGVCSISGDHGLSGAGGIGVVDHHLQRVGAQGQGDGTADANGLAPVTRAVS